MVISNIEHEADTIKQSIRAHLSNSIFSPVKRSEILAMLKTQDAVADRCEDTAMILTMRRTPFPEFLKDDFMALVAKVLETTNLLTDTTRELNRIAEESGSARDKQAIIEGIDHIHEVEHEADIIEERLRTSLFDRESEVDPVTIIILLDLFLKVGHIADAAENVSDAIRCWLETA
jgi:predicted phosphate transport protein (TIGR00153 family)